MVTKAQKVRVVIFISTISLIFLYIIFLLVGQKLFTREDVYYVRLKQQSASGLNVGQDVKYYGITIGKITDITINNKDISEIILKISIKKETPIKKTVKASINLAGITGFKVVELTGGENSDPDLKPGSYIEADRGMLDNITGKAEIITEKIEQVINNILEMTDNQNRSSLKHIIAKTDSTINHFDGLIVKTGLIITNNQQNISDLLENSNRLIITLNETSTSIKYLATSANRALNSKETTLLLKNISELSSRINTPKIDSMVTNLNGFIAQGNQFVGHLDKTFISNRKNIVKSIELLKEALDNFNELMVLMRENPDIIIKGKQNE